MTGFDALLFICLCTATALALSLPRKYQIDCVSFATVLLLAFAAPVTLAWMSTTILLTFGISHLPRTQKTFGTWAVVLVIAIMFTLYKTINQTSAAFDFQPPVLLGLAYFFCRQIHLLVEGLIYPTMRLSLRQHINYNFFLPVLLAGPIHRYQHFFRQCDRRRTDKATLAGSFERILYGYAKVIIGNALISYHLAEFLEHLHVTGLTSLLLQSANDWLYLYVQFSGYTDIALGFSLLLGIRLEENFNNPLAATTLIEFWQRWHMTLSNWCRDYVFAPVQAASRNQFIAVSAAMIVMGLWHEFSWYYLLWGLYHATGISLCRAYQQANDPLRLRSLPLPLRNGITRFATLTWIVAGIPVISTILSFLKTSNT